jgi:hypothetical protein
MQLRQASNREGKGKKKYYETQHPSPVPSLDIPSYGHFMVRPAVVNSPKSQGSLLVGSDQKMTHAQ